MALIAAYQGFKVDLAGYHEVPFDDFRRKLAPLRYKRSGWTGEDEGYVKQLVEAGAGYALRRLLGHNQAAAGALGGGGALPEPMTRGELDTHMTALLKSCQAAGWSSGQFQMFAAYLDSDMTRAQLHARERQKLAALHPGREQAGAPHAALADEDPVDATVYAEDRFAEMYRGAGPAFRQVVLRHLEQAARVTAGARAPVATVGRPDRAAAATTDTPAPPATDPAAPQATDPPAHPAAADTPTPAPVPQ